MIGSIYRAALDVSFRRSGGLFVILHNQNQIRSIVREGDAIGDRKRIPPDREFDRVVEAHKIQSLPRAVAVELASLDGAVVLANSGKIALKISSDGDMTVYYKGDEFFSM